MRARSISAAFFLFCCIFAALPPGARASLVLGLSLEDLSAQADEIVVATIGEQQAERSANGLIITRSKVQVSQRIKGAANRAVHDFVTLGGEVGDVGMSVVGAPQFVKGERVVLFLRDAGQNEMQVLGLAQGAFSVQRVNGVDVVEQHMENLKLVGGRAALRQSRSLNSFLSEVRTLVAEKKSNRSP